MIPDAVYPGPLPLAREAAIDVLTHLDRFEGTGGVFLSFVMIPLEERIGGWRFAGVSDSLAAAVRCVESFASQMLGPGDEGLLLPLFRDMTWVNDWNYPTRPPLAVTGPHRLVLSVVSDAPYDDYGGGIVEVESLAGSGYEDRPPDLSIPEEWQKRPVLDWLVAEGTERFGEPPDDVLAALVYDATLEHLTRLRETWSELTGWGALMPPEGS